MCDMAETYGVLDITALPVPLLATLAAGLGEDSRSARKEADAKSGQTALLLAAIADRIGYLYAAITGADPAPSLVQALTAAPGKGGPLETFETMEEFELARQKILKGAENGSEH